MIANYHTHTFRCHHAYGEEWEYVENAIEGGLKILGFTDHSPQIFPDGYVSPIRMLPDELDDYIRSIDALKQKYEGKIEIHCGLEAEYYPALFPQLMDFLQEHEGVEYLILGQHFADNEYEEYHQYARSWEGDQEHKLAKYVDQVIAGMETGKFLYLAHPDVCLFEGDLPIYRKHMRRLCQAANACDLPIEINAQGTRFTGNYPYLPFWELAAEEGCVAVYGSDAHRPHFTCNAEANAQLEAVAKACGIRILDTLEIKKENGK